MSEKYILVRVYKDVEVKDDDDYIENAISMATDFLGDFDTEIIEVEDENDKLASEIETECIRNKSTRE